MHYSKFNPIYLGKDTVLIKTKRDLFLRVDARDVLISQQLIVNGEWDPALSNLYDKILFPGANYMEIGCHIGYFSVLASCLVGISGHCTLFEPNPRSMRLLKENLRGNILTHICDIHEIAISDSIGETEFVQFTTNSGGSSLAVPDQKLLSEFAEQPVVTRCKKTTLDNLLLSDSRSYDFVKIDAEGSEARIFSGGEIFFRKCLHERSVIICEYNPPALRAVGGDPSKLLMSLAADGREVFSYSENGIDRKINSIEDLSDTCNTEVIALSTKRRKEIFGV
jgi:FkbM family methyltransferase